jgi:hypothetical protein
MAFVLQPALLPAEAHAAVSASKIADATFDVLILRPFGLVATVIGGALFVPAVLLASPNGKQGFEQARERFITPTVDSTFKRGLGDF